MSRLNCQWLPPNSNSPSAVPWPAAAERARQGAARHLADRDHRRRDVAVVERVAVGVAAGHLERDHPAGALDADRPVRRRLEGVAGVDRGWRVAGLGGRVDADADARQRAVLERRQRQRPGALLVDVVGPARTIGEPAEQRVLRGLVEVAVGRGRVRLVVAVVDRRRAAPAGRRAAPGPRCRHRCGSRRPARRGRRYSPS